MFLQFSFGLTACHLAAMRGAVRLFKKLEAEDAVIDARDQRGRRPVEVAQANEQRKMTAHIETSMLLPKMKVEY